MGGCTAATWEGNDECDPASGSGWVNLLKDGSLSGHICFHQGDDSGFRAIAFQEEQQTSSSSKRGLR